MATASVPESSKTFQKGQIIFREGQTTPVAYMVKKGSVLLYRVVNNRRVVIAQMKPGQIFGEMSLITNEPANATAEAEVHTELIVFDRIFLQSLLLKSPNPIQRIVRHLLDQLHTMHTLVQERPYEDIFLGVCQLLELFTQAQGQAPPDEPRSRLKNAVSHADFCRAVKTILLVPQHEIDEVLDKLHKLNLVIVRDIKAATYKKNILGEVNKSSEYLRDSIIVINDPLRFMSAARNLRKEMGAVEAVGSSRGLQYMDIHDLAAKAGVEVGVIHRLLAQRELPDGLLCFPAELAERWLGSLDDDYFTLEGQAKWRERGMIADDIVDEDNAALQFAFSQLGHEKLLILYAAAGEAAKKKIRENVSKKLKKEFEEESRSLKVGLGEVVAIEEELFRMLERVKKEA